MSEKGEPTNPYVTDYPEFDTGEQPEVLHGMPFNMTQVDVLRYDAQTEVVKGAQDRLKDPDFLSKVQKSEGYGRLTTEQRTAVLELAMKREAVRAAHIRAVEALLKAKGLTESDAEASSLEFLEQADMLGEMMGLDTPAFSELAKEPTIEKLKELTDKQAAEQQELQDQVPRYYRRHAEISLDADDYEPDESEPAPAPKPQPSPKPQPKAQPAAQNSQPTTAKPNKGKQSGQQVDEPEQPEASKEKFDLLKDVPFSWEQVTKARNDLEREARAKTNKLLGNLPKPKNDKERAAQTAERSLYYMGAYERTVDDYVETAMPYYGSGESKEAVDKKRDILKLVLRMDPVQFEKNRKDAAEVNGTSTPEVQAHEDTVDIIGILNGSVVPETGSTTNNNGENTQNQPENGERNKGKYRVGDYLVYKENDGTTTEAMIVGVDKYGFKVRELNVAPDGTWHEELVTMDNGVHAPTIQARLDEQQARTGETYRREERFGISRGFNFNVISREGFRYNCEVIAFPPDVNGQPRLTVLDTGVDPNGRPYQRAHDVVGAADIQKFLDFALRTKQGEAQAQAQAEAARQRAEAEQNRPQGNPAFEALTVPEPDLNDDERQDLRQNPFLQRDRNGRLIPTPRLLAGSRLEAFARQMLASRQFVRPNRNMVDAVMRDLQAANPQLVRAQNDRNPVVFTNQRVNLNWSSIDYMERNKQVPRIDHFIVQNNISDFAGLARELLAMGGISFEVKGKEAQEQLARQTDRVVRALAGANNTPPYGRYLNPGRINVTPDVWNLVDQIATGRQNGNRNRR